MTTKPKRTRKIMIRLTEGELAAIRAKAAARGMSMANLARRLLVEVEHIEISQTRRRRGVIPARLPAPTADPELVRQVARIGNNLNQIARRVNTTGIEAVELLAQLAALDRNVWRLLEPQGNPDPDQEGRADDD